MNKKYIWWIAAVVVVAVVYFGFIRSGKKNVAELIVAASQGDFEILVTVTGELQAKNFERIVAPDIRSSPFRLNELRIMDMVAEGTIVDSGDWIADLDRNAARNEIINLIEQIELEANRVETTEMDTTVRLSGLRDNLLNMALSVEEAKIRVEQSVYEPPATQRQAQMDVERIERSLAQQQAQYRLSEMQMRNNMANVLMRLERMERQLERMEEVLEGFTIRAPRNGMVIYFRDRMGQRRRAGSNFSTQDNVVATLPDMSVMISTVYVNEIDISKVRLGQDVRVGMDAFPDRNYTGTVVRVAGVGEQLANTDAKVFEVTIEINESDPIMRPLMTTSNAIVINSITDVTFVSIDAIYTLDSIPYVYRTNNTRQIVVLGEANDNQIIVEHGLSPGDRVHLSTPENSANWRLVGEDLIPLIRQRELERLQEQEERERRTEEENRRAGRRWDGNPDGARGGQPGGGGFPGGGGGPGGGQPGGGGQQGGGEPRGGGGGGQRGGGSI